MLLYFDTEMSCSHINIGNICIPRTCKIIHNIRNEMHKSRAFQLKIQAGFKCCIVNMTINNKLAFNQYFTQFEKLM